ncbi:glutathione-dependent formaldehyde-activating GFA [Thozetella sp. PMI_491]|nr:glutathione-dependent formaldehyde-activating GFA [Thozetella sp. PMI_491]
MEETVDLGPLPKRIEGGCLCGSIRYKVEFPEDHSFQDASGTCQCTSCRKSTSSLFFMWHNVPKSCVTWTETGNTRKNYYCTEGCQRGFCTNCGTFLYFCRDAGVRYGLAIGTVDALYLFGEGWEKTKGEVPEHGFGLALASSYGGHCYTRNEIKGVTDNLALCGIGRGERLETDET